MDRKLTGIFIRVENSEGGYDAKDLSDCTGEQVLNWLEKTNANNEFLKGTVVKLVDIIRSMGDSFDIRMVESE